jgi:integrase
LTRGRRWFCDLAMPRNLPPYVLRQRTRHGKVVFYFRRGDGPRIRLPDPTDPEFPKAYAAAFASPRIHAPATKDTLSMLIASYRISSAYAALSPATRRQRDNIFLHVEKSAGHIPFRDITRQDIVDGRERRKDTPAQSRNFLDAVRGLFRWAHDSGLVKEDPTETVSNPPKSRSRDGFPIWTDEDVVRYGARWPVGSVERRWLDVLVHTGLRRGDAVRLHSDHVKAGMIELQAEKTGTTVYVPLAPELAGIVGWFIVGEMGRPMAKESFGNAFREACRQAGVEKSAHGLRKLAATKWAERGLTVTELEALFGWSGGTMASHYTKTASRKRVAERVSLTFMKKTVTP